MPPVKNIDRIPVQPLIDFVERKGGAAKALPGTGFTIGTDADAVDDPKANTLLVDRTDDERARIARFQNNLNTAVVGDGTLSLFTADRLCCDYLGVHPVEVYGMEWYDFGEPLSAPMERWVDQWAAGPVARLEVVA